MLDLPDAPFAAPLRDLADAADVEQAFFLEGVDGHAESVPSEPETFVAPIGAQPVELEDEAEQEDVEDPARARRRRAARIGVVCGAALMVGVAGASAFMSPHGRERAPVALSANPAPVEPAKVEAERVASSPATTPIAATPPRQVSPEPQPAAAVAPPRPAARVMTASTKATGAAHPRAVAHKKGPAPSRGAKASPTSPKGSSTRASQTRTPSTRVAASKPRRRGQTTAGAKASG